MNLTQIIGKKLDQSQGFLENGKRVPMSRISVNGNVVCQIKTMDTDGYNALQIGFGVRNKAKKAIAGHIKKAGIETTPRFFREIRVDETPNFELGSLIEVATILEPGDIVNVTGTSKGKGFAGAVKRWNFRGGPRTHGQSNREKAPGSSGSGTTPGRVFKGKRRAGHMGVDTVTVRNLEVLAINGDEVVIKGLVPGIRGQVVTITRVGKTKKHVGLYKTEEEKAAEAQAEAANTVEEVAETSVEEPKVEEAPAEEAKAEAAVEETVVAASAESSAEPKEEKKSEEPKEEVSK
jgi:large subunit ribosomal protein L3